MANNRWLGRDTRADARTLRDAAQVLLAYSRKPDGLWCTALVKMLRKAADGIDAGRHP